MSSISAYLQLIRFPDLFTAIAVAPAGYLIVTGAQFQGMCDVRFSDAIHVSAVQRGLFAIPVAACSFAALFFSRRLAITYECIEANNRIKEA